MRAEIPPQAELRVPPQTETQDRLRLHRPIRLGGTGRLQRKRLSGRVTNAVLCRLFVENHQFNQEKRNVPNSWPFAWQGSGQLTNI